MNGGEIISEGRRVNGKWRRVEGGSRGEYSRGEKREGTVEAIAHRRPGEGGSEIIRVGMGGGGKNSGEYWEWGVESEEKGNRVEGRSRKGKWQEGVE